MPGWPLASHGSNVRAGPSLVTFSKPPLLLAEPMETQPGSGDPCDRVPTSLCGWSPGSLPCSPGSARLWVRTRGRGSWHVGTAEMSPLGGAGWVVGEHSVLGSRTPLQASTRSLGLLAQKASPPWGQRAAAPRPPRVQCVNQGPSLRGGPRWGPGPLKDHTPLPPACPQGCRELLRAPAAVGVRSRVPGSPGAGALGESQRGPCRAAPCLVLPRGTCQRSGRQQSGGEGASGVTGQLWQPCRALG